MAIKFEKIKEGMTLYDVRKNTSMSSNKWSVWVVKVIEVNTEERKALVSWNTNKPEWMHERRVTKYRAKPPENKSKY